MPVFHEALTVGTTTAYAQIHASALAQSVRRDVAALRGSFGSKTVRGTTQWYFSFRDPAGVVRQLYVGPDTAAVHALIEAHREARHGASGETTEEQLKRLARVAQTLGCATTERAHLAVALRLAAFGLFHAGGVLVGTHAFLAYANMLGLRWTSPDTTSDLDFARAGKAMAIALPATFEARPGKALATMAEGFLPMVQFGGQAGASCRHSKQAEFQIDFLTPRTRNSDKPIAVEHLDVLLQPLRFMELSLEDVAKATLADSLGRVVTVTVPAPERYAVHKLLVAASREASWQSKVSKDLRQAAALIEFFAEQAPETLASIVRDVAARGPTWRKALRAGIALLVRAHPAQGHTVQPWAIA